MRHNDRNISWLILNLCWMHSEAYHCSSFLSMFAVVVQSWCVCVCESSLLQLQMLGIISNSVSSQSSPEVSLQSDSAEWRLMKDYDLLYCFRRDSNKVQNYLKILKCRIVPEHGCWGPERSRGRLQLPETTHTQDHTIKAVAFVVFCMGTDANICSWSATGTQRLCPPPRFMPDTEITGYVVNVITDSCRMYIMFRCRNIIWNIPPTCIQCCFCHSYRQSYGKQQILLIKNVFQY